MCLGTPWGLGKNAYTRMTIKPTLITKQFSAILYSTDIVSSSTLYGCSLQGGKYTHYYLRTRAGGCPGCWVGFHTIPHPLPPYAAHPTLFFVMDN